VDPPSGDLTSADQFQSTLGITAPIIGSRKAAQLKELIAATDLTLSAEEVAALAKPYRPHGILGHFQPEPKAMRAAKVSGLPAVRRQL